MIDSILALLAQYRWTSITGLADLSSVDLSYINRGIRAAFQAGLDPTSGNKLRYNDLPYNDNEGPAAMEDALRRMSEISRSKKLYLHNRTKKVQ